MQHNQPKSKIFQVSVPGSLMLFGEHAVLRGKPSVVAAVNKRIIVKLIPRADRIIQIDSANYGSCKLNLDSFKIHPDFRFVTAAIKSKQRKIKTGFTLHIAASFAANLGLGSSAAVTVATIALLEYWVTGKKPKAAKLCLDARKIIRSVQGIGSGADVAAAVYGGVVAYNMQPFRAQRIATALPLTVIYSGSKLATPIVIAKVSAAERQHPQVYRLIFNALGNVTQLAIRAIKKGDFSHLGELMNMHQSLQAFLGVSNATLEQLLAILRVQAKIYGAKISGSGLGDCVIGLGKTQMNFNVAQCKQGIKQIEIAIDAQGILYGA